MLFFSTEIDGVGHNEKQRATVCLYVVFYARVGPAGSTDSALAAAAPSLVVTALRGAAVYKNASCSLVAFVFPAVVDILIKIINFLPQKGHKSTRKHPRGPKSHQKASPGPLVEGDLQFYPKRVTRVPESNHEAPRATKRLQKAP